VILDELLRVAHTGAVALYIGGAIIVTLGLRRAQRFIPPAQAAVVGNVVGTLFTYISWLALATWVGSGYWLLARRGWASPTSPHTLFVDPDLLKEGYGWMMILMISSWLGMLINAVLITFVFRPRLVRRLEPSHASPQVVERLQRQMMLSARMVEALALVNLLLCLAGTLAGHRFFEHVYIYTAS
jgi:hypothetical protein